MDHGDVAAMHPMCLPPAPAAACIFGNRQTRPSRSICGQLHVYLYPIRHELTLYPIGDKRLLSPLEDKMAEIDDTFPESTVRSVADIGHALLRARRHMGLTQAEVGARVRMKQGTISNLENGSPGTTLRTLTLVLSALNLEIVVRRRRKANMEDWGVEP